MDGCEAIEYNGPIRKLSVIGQPAEILVAWVRIGRVDDSYMRPGFVVIFRNVGRRSKA